MIFKIFILFQLFSCIQGNIDQSITIKPLVYHLKLEEDKHYVGITYNLNQRYAQHISGDGAKWTKLHKPMDVEQVWMEGSEELENQITLQLMDVYGRDNVRGGKFTKIILTDKKEIQPEENDPLTELDQIMEFSKNEWVQNILKAYQMKSIFPTLDLNNIIKSNGQWYCKNPRGPGNLILIEMYNDAGNSRIQSHGHCESVPMEILNGIWKLHNEDHKFIQELVFPQEEYSKLMPLYNYYKAIE